VSDRVSDVTALWNTNAFFAYVFTVKIFQLKWEPRRLMVILLASLGVVVVVYGSSQPGASTAKPASSHVAAIAKSKATSPLVGDLLTLLASVIYGLYQVLYKKYVALPSDPELLSDGLYERIATFDENTIEEIASSEETIYPPPFGLHPNLFTSLIGLLTFVVFWIPLPLLHYFDIEQFSFPTDRATYFTIAGIAASGVLFNAGFMVCDVVHLSNCVLQFILLFLVDPFGYLGSSNHISRQFTHHCPRSVLGRSSGRRWRHYHVVESDRCRCYCRCLWRVGIRYV
jgi:drug/metabolite transporter (DMT)-like permease